MNSIQAFASVRKLCCRRPNARAQRTAADGGLDAGEDFARSGVNRAKLFQVECGEFDLSPAEEVAVTFSIVDTLDGVRLQVSFVE